MRRVRRGRVAVVAHAAGPRAAARPAPVRRLRAGRAGRLARGVRRARQARARRVLQAHHQQLRRAQGQGTLRASPPPAAPAAPAAAHRRWSLQVLNQFSQIPNLYHTPEFAGLEGAARENIEREICTLREHLLTGRQEPK